MVLSAVTFQPDFIVISFITVSVLSIFLVWALLSWYLRSLKIRQHNGDLWVMVTGCDTGFGNRCAKKLNQLGIHVFAACLTSAGVENLAATCSDLVIPLQMDVTDKTSVQAAKKIIEDCLPKGKGLWALVNNAGIVGTAGASEWMTKSDFQKTLDVNVLGTISVTNTFLPLLRRAHGRIINMASVLGRFAAPPVPYTVSKFCVQAYTDCLRRELAQQDVSVHTIEPGGFQTSITNAQLHISSMERAYSNLDPQVRQYYGDKYKERLEIMLKLGCYVLGSSNLDKVVDTYIHAITARYPKSRYTIGWDAHFVFRPLWMLPTCLTDFCVGMLYRWPQGA